MLKNAIVCMFDSWQFNYAGCYGNDWIKTPNIDAFAREGVLFENAYGNNMPTLPVRRSMMTGRYTLQDTGWGPLRREDLTIADLCFGTGTDTALIYNTPVMFADRASFGRGYATCRFSHGFDHYYFVKDQLYDHYTVDQYYSDIGYLDRLRAKEDGAFIEKFNRHEYELYLRDKQHWKKDDDHTVAVNIHEAIHFLERMWDRGHNLHMWIDNWDPHEPWDPPSVWTDGMDCPYDPGYKGADMWLPPMSPVKDLLTEEQMHHIRMLFAEKITLCDKYFGELMSCMRRLGMWENTLLWLTADHGEPMGNAEHGHGLMTKCRPWPYEELVHIPLIIKAPGLPAGKRIKGFVQDCDCAPTILDWLEVPIPPTMTGKSLLPLARGEVNKIRDFAIAGYFDCSWSIITEEWSYIHWINKIEENGSLSEFYSVALGLDSSLFVNGSASNDVSISNSISSYREEHSLGNEDQWTCTPGARKEIPEGDELYIRKTDPFQLHNVITEYPDIAHELLSKLKNFMSELKAS